MRSSLSDSNQETKQDNCSDSGSPHTASWKRAFEARSKAGERKRMESRRQRRFSSGKRGSVRGGVGVKKWTQRAALECWQLPHSSP